MNDDKIYPSEVFRNPNDFNMSEEMTEFVGEMFGFAEKYIRQLEAAGVTEIESEAVVPLPPYPSLDKDKLSILCDRIVIRACRAASAIIKDVIDNGVIPMEEALADGNLLAKLIFEFYSMYQAELAQQSINVLGPTLGKEMHAISDSVLPSLITGFREYPTIFREARFTALQEDFAKIHAARSNQYMQSVGILPQNLHSDIINSLGEILSDVFDHQDPQSIIGMFSKNITDLLFPDGTNGEIFMHYTQIAMNLFWHELYKKDLVSVVADPQITINSYINQFRQLSDDEFMLLDHRIWDVPEMKDDPNYWAIIMAARRERERRWRALDTVWNGWFKGNDIKLWQIHRCVMQIKSNNEVLDPITREYLEFFGHTAPDLEVTSKKDEFNRREIIRIKSTLKNSIRDKQYIGDTDPHVLPY